MYVGTEFTFTDASTGEGLTYAWDFDGDGEVDSTDQNPTYSFDESGTYTVSLTVTDSSNETSTYSTDIVIEQQQEEERDIVSTAESAGFDTLVTALEAAGLADTLKGEGPYTVFAPTDEAFDAVNQTWLSALLEDTTNLTKVLLYHVIHGEVMAEDVIALGNTTVITLLFGSNLTTTIVNGTDVYVDDVPVAQADIQCSNGVIHVIDAVLIPEAVTGPEE